MNKRSSMSNIEKHDEALKVMPKLFSENGFNVSVIDPPYAGYQEISDLSIYNDLDGVDAYLSKSIFPEAAGNSTSWEYLKKNKGFRYAVFRCAPVIIRGLIYDEGNYNTSDTMYNQVLDGISIGQVGVVYGPECQVDADHQHHGG